MSQGKFEDLSGQKYGKLTVLYRAEDYIQPSGQHKRMWHCKCECGVECNVRASDLKSGNTQSCGCFQQYARGKSQLEDLSGHRFGNLTVLYRAPNHITPSGQKQRVWHCKCDCGKEIDIYAMQLKNGKLDCGCIATEKRLKKKEEKEKRKQEAERRRQRDIKRLAKANAKAKHISKKNRIIDYPETLKEWDYDLNGSISPDNVSMNTVVWWKCPSGKHSYDMRISSRIGKQKCGCPYCSIPAKRVLKGFNDLATKYPDIACEWHPTKNGSLTPDQVLCGSARKVWWLGKCGHAYEQGIVNRTGQGSNCPYCSHQKLLVGFNDLATTNPDILDEWDYDKNTVTPTEIGVGAHYKAWWKCPFGHSYQAYPSNRCGKTHSGCPICDKENHTSFPEQALYFYVKKYFPDAINSDRSAAGLELDIYIPSLNIAIEYDGKTWHKNNKYELKKNKVCKEKNILLMRIREEGLDLYDDCYCLVRNNVRENDSLSAVIRKVLYDIDMISETDVDVDRDSGLIYSSYISTRKEQSLQNTYPEIAAEWHPSKNGGLTPEMVAPMTNKKVWWLGKCGHEWNMDVASRIGKQKCGCPICSNKQVLKGFNDLQTKFPQLCKEWDYEKNNKLGIFPDEVTSGSDKRVWWKCSVCGNEWQREIGVVAYSAKTYNRNGCRICADRYTASAKFKPVKCVETGIIYSSLKEAEQLTGISRSCIGNCCKGTQKTAGKMHWEYAIESETDKI